MVDEERGEIMDRSVPVVGDGGGNGIGNGNGGDGDVVVVVIDLVVKRRCGE